MTQSGSRSSGPWARVALVVGGFAAITAPASLAADQLPGASDGYPGVALRAAAGLLLVVPLVLLACRYQGRRPAAVLGLDWQRRGWPNLVVVALATVGAFAVVVGVAVSSGSAAVDRAALGTATLTMLTVTPLLVAASAVPEELVFRGYVQHVLGGRLAPWSAIAGQAALYAVCISVIALSFDNIASAFLTGIGLGYLRLFSDGLWGALGFRISLTATTAFMTGAGLEFTSGAPVWNLALGAGPFFAALAGVLILRPKNAEQMGLNDPVEPATTHRELSQKGILYDVGTSYMPGQHSRARWHPEVVREELRVIYEDLHCTAVILFGESPERLEEAGRMALEQGLYAWLQPRRFDEAVPQVLENLAQVADTAERLRTDHPDRVGLSVGCEISLLHRGVLPGHLPARSRWLAVVGAIAPPYLGWRTNRVLSEMVAVAREHFDGPLSYAAGTWEPINWNVFDVIGVNYYTDEITQTDYRGGLRRLAAHGKPALVTEFGCCSYEGSQGKGGSGSDIMDWSDLSDRRIKGNHVRDEQVQADHLDAQLDIFETEDVHGAFLCMFIEGDCHYSTDPTRDLDMASFGIVRPPTPESGLSADDGHWEPKLAFHALARRYGARVPAEPSQPSQI